MNLIKRWLNNSSTHHIFHQLHQLISVLLNKGYLLVFWVILITWLSLKPMVAPQIVIAGFDKVAHFIFYGILAFLLNHQKVILNKSNIKMQFVFLICALYGLGIELIQGTIIDGRYFELWDLIANIIGIFIGIIISNFFFK